MSVELKSGASADLLTVDPISKAARMGLYNPDGSLVFPVFDGNYSLPIEVVPSTLTDATTYFAFRNTGAKNVHIHRIRVKLGFIGTEAGSGSRFSMHRFSAATPTGGTALTPTKFDSSFAASSVGDARYAPGGLTVAGVTFEEPFEFLGVSSNHGNDCASMIEFGEHKFILASNEGFAIKARGAIVSGAWIIGAISWDEAD